MSGGDGMKIMWNVGGSEERMFGMVVALTVNLVQQMGGAVEWIEFVHSLVCRRLMYKLNVEIGMPPVIKVHLIIYTVRALFVYAFRVHEMRLSSAFVRVCKREIEITTGSGANKTSGVRLCYSGCV